MLNSLPQVANYAPTDPELRKAFDRILHGRRPQQQYLCTQLGLTDQLYRQWLGTLFMLLLAPVNSSTTMFVALIKGLLEDPNQHLQALVCTYDDEAVLLSDRGYCELVEQGIHHSFAFNLCSKAFVIYFFSDIDKFVDGRIRPEVLRGMKAMPKQMHVRHERNNLAILEAYNRNAIYQCHERVYCSRSTGIRR
jgi:hypothetical protein